MKQVNHIISLSLGFSRVKGLLKSSCPLIFSSQKINKIHNIVLAFFFLLCLVLEPGFSSAQTCHINSISPTSTQSINANGGGISYNLNLTSSSCTPSFVNVPSWLSVSYTYSGTGIISVSANANNTGTTRSATVSVKPSSTGTVEATFSVTQNATVTYYITLDTPSLSFPASGGTLTFHITSTNTPSQTISFSGCVSNAVLSGNTVTVSCPPNTGNPTGGSVVVMGGNTSAGVSVSQDGCTPVTTANAGSDQTGSSTCGLTSVPLAGNTPTVGTGLWSIVNGTGGTIATPTSPTSTFTGIAGNTYTLRWSISNSCSLSIDDVSVKFNRNPTAANAGPDQTGASTCGNSVTLAGNTPTVGTGLWSIVSGVGGNIATPTSATSTFTGTAGTTYTLRWTISNSPCPSLSDDVIITFNRNPTHADAGPDQTDPSTCGLTSVTLAGNTPMVGTGLWSIVSGAGGTITSPTNPSSIFTGTAGTAYTLRWTISNSPCPSSSDDVNITFNKNAMDANAGPDQTGPATCGLTVTLAANTPIDGTGVWSIVYSTASGSFSNTVNPTSTFTGVSGNTYTLRWTIYPNSPCTPTTDDMNITFGQTVGNPIFLLGANSSRCLGAGTVTYTATATNTTGITYSLDAASITGGNSINSSTGAVTYIAGWSGISTITASAAGSGGPKTANHTATTTPTVGTPVFTLGSTSTRAQGAGAVTYTATATNTTGITYSLDAASITGGNSINSSTGTVTYVAGWSGISTITASAAGSGGPKTANHTATTTPTVGIPVFTLGSTSTRAQGAGAVTYNSNCHQYYRNNL